MALESFVQLLVYTDNPDFDPLLPDDVDLYSVNVHCFVENHNPNNDNYPVLKMTQELISEIKSDWNYTTDIPMGSITCYVYYKRTEE